MRRILALVVALLLAMSIAAPAGAATKPLPVPYSFLPTAVFGGTPDADAPGTNDWSCQPTDAHPRPVVLVHGTVGNRATNWQTYGPLLKNNGYCVFALTYGALPAPYPINALGGLGDMRVSAEQLGAFVDEVLAATGATQVDILGHSQGTLMPSYWVKYLGGAPKVHTYVSLAPLWKGTGGLTSVAQLGALLGIPVDELPLCTACGQFAPNSDFMAQIREGGAAVPGIEYVNIVTKYDQLVTPYTSGIEDGMTNIVLQDGCSLNLSEHFQIAADRNASRHVLNALDPANARPVPCTLSLPYVGGL